MIIKNNKINQSSVSGIPKVDESEGKFLTISNNTLNTVDLTDIINDLNISDVIPHSLNKCKSSLIQGTGMYVVDNMLIVEPMEQDGIVLTQQLNKTTDLFQLGNYRGCKDESYSVWNSPTMTSNTSPWGKIYSMNSAGVVSNDTTSWKLLNKMPITSSSESVAYYNTPTQVLFINPTPFIVNSMVIYNHYSSTYRTSLLDVFVGDNYENTIVDNVYLSNDYNGEYINIPQQNRIENDTIGLNLKADHSFYLGLGKLIINASTKYVQMQSSYNVFLISDEYKTKTDVLISNFDTPIMPMGFENGAYTKIGTIATDNTYNRFTTSYNTGISFDTSIPVITTNYKNEVNVIEQIEDYHFDYKEPEKTVNELANDGVITNRIIQNGVTPIIDNELTKLTLKKGSVLKLPNGESLTINQDITKDLQESNSGVLYNVDNGTNLFLLYNNEIISVPTSKAHSITNSHTPSTSYSDLVYNTDTNTILGNINGSFVQLDNCSLPFLQVKVSDNIITDIVKLETTSYIGGSVFILNDCNYICPNGLTNEGKYNSSIIENNSLEIFNIGYNNLYALGGVGIIYKDQTSSNIANCYYEQYSPPSLLMPSNSLWFDVHNNQMYYDYSEDNTTPLKNSIALAKIISARNEGIYSTMNITEIEPIHQLYTVPIVEDYSNNSNPIKLYITDEGKIYHNYAKNWGAVTSLPIKSNHGDICFLCDQAEGVGYKKYYDLWEETTDILLAEVEHNGSTITDIKLVPFNHNGYIKDDNIPYYKLYAPLQGNTNEHIKLEHNLDLGESLISWKTDVSLVCINPEHGYQDGDIASVSRTQSVNTIPMRPYLTDKYIGVSTTSLKIFERTNGEIVTPNYSNWQMLFRIWK